MNRYCISGLSVLSEIALPGLMDLPPGGAEPLVVIRRGEVPAALPDATAVHATHQIAGDLFLFTVPNVARFLLRAGREITVACDDGVPEADVAIFVSGTVFGILLHQRGQFVLHASAVRVGDAAVLFCGNSGAGKSTMAAALGKHGYAMLADDLCAVQSGDGRGPLVQPDGRRLKLWAHAVEKLDLAERRGDAVRSKIEKFYIEPLQAATTALPVRAVYLLRETRAPAKDGIVEANFVDATVMIRKNAYRPRLVRALDQQTHYLQSAAAMIAKAGVYALHRPLDFGAFPQTVSRLEGHWRALGLLETRS